MVLHSPIEKGFIPDCPRGVLNDGVSAKVDIRDTKAQQEKIATKTPGMHI